MKKVLLDTNVYIDWLNRRQHEQWLLGSGLVRTLSAVVAMELRVGATTAKSRKAVDRLERAYARGNRLVAPQPAQFRQAGEALRRLQRSGRNIRHASLHHDLLIATTARSLGATVVTRDVKDFRAISKVLDFEWEPID